MRETREVIAFLNQQYTNYHPEIDEDSDVSPVELQEWTEHVYGRLSNMKPLPEAISVEDTEKLSQHSYHLMMFRACLGREQQHGDGTYLSLCNNEVINGKNNVYARTLKLQANPFLMAAHFGKLMALSEENLSPQDKLLYAKTVNDFVEQIKSLHPNEAGAFQNFLAGCSSLLLIKMIDMLPEEKRDHSVVENLRESAEQFFANAKHSDGSVELYLDTDILRNRMPYKSIDEALEALSAQCNSGESMACR